MAPSKMARPKSDNDTALHLLLPGPWLEEADALARELSEPGAARTRADALRMAIRRGMDVLRAEHREGAPREGVKARKGRR
jgi:hypothetical protein